MSEVVEPFDVAEASTFGKWSGGGAQARNTAKEFDINEDSKTNISRGEIPVYSSRTRNYCSRCDLAALVNWSLGLALMGGRQCWDTQRRPASCRLNRFTVGN